MLIPKNGITLLLGDRKVYQLSFALFHSSNTPKMDDKLSRFKRIMDDVYGPYTSNWKPSPYADGKSRYLWTDAYGVCNYLTLFKETGQNQYLEQAGLLISAVHDELGRTRDGSKRLGDSTPEHPLNGGLRIGKGGEEDISMSGDGQYFHYLTKWMFALNRMSEVTKDEQYNRLAMELVKAVHFKFCTADRQRMIWKMSIDLSRPLTYSEGSLDTFDGLTMYLILQETARNFAKFNEMSDEEKRKWEELNLKQEITHLEMLVASRIKRFSAHDTLDAGEALWLAHFFPERDYCKQLKLEAGYTVEALWESGEFEGSPRNRLAFREFGTAIGVQFHMDMWKKWESRVEKLHEFWLKNLQLRDNDITPVMYCTSLKPGVFMKCYL